MRWRAQNAIPVAVGAVYLAATAFVAARRPLWNDEVYTYTFARLPTVADLWRALETGADQAPPLSYLLTRASTAVLGTSPFAVRVPELAAFLVFAILLYVFVARRTSPLYGALAMLLPGVTAAYYYAAEARAYALVLAAGALALVCWQLATEGAHRRAALAGLALALALATSSHYYAVLLLIPLALGELARTVAAGRVDLPVWAAFSAAVLPLLAFVDLVRAARGYSADFWGRPAWRDPLAFYSFLFDVRPTADGIALGQIGRPTVWALSVLALVVLSAAVAVLGPALRWLQARRAARVALPVALPAASLLALLVARRSSEAEVGVWQFVIVGVATALLGIYLARGSVSRRPLGPPLPTHELVAAGGFLLLPVAGVVLAKAVTNSYADRYALPAVIGLVVVPLAIHRVEGLRPAVGVVLVGTLVAGFASLAVLQGVEAVRSANDQRRTLEFLRQNVAGDEPILVDNPHRFLELSHAAPPPLAARFVYVADPTWDSTQRGLIELGSIAGLSVFDRDDLRAIPASLLAYSPPAEAASTSHGWSGVAALRELGWTVRLHGARSGARMNRGQVHELNRPEQTS